MLREAVRKVANVDDRSSLSTRVRARRFELFRSLLDTVSRPVRLIDVGGTETFWESMGAADLPDVSILVVNLSAPPSNHPGITTAVGDATDLHGLADADFDVAFSNSVIEHVGGFSAQRDMADELLRVAPRLYLQTPNRWFPIEPHFLFPGFAWLPIPARAWMVRHFALGWRDRVPDPQEALEVARSVRLMTMRELRILFPKATIERERFFGLTKSFLVYQGWDR
jgi:hypothetical protein